MRSVSIKIESFLQQSIRNVKKGISQLLGFSNSDVVRAHRPAILNCIACRYVLTNSLYLY